MAPNRSPAFFAEALLLLLTAAAPLVVLAQAPPPPPQVIGPYGMVVPPELVPDALKITGVRCCTPNGRCSGGPRIAGVNYKVVCNGFFVLAKGSTGVNGDFNVTLTNVPAVSYSLWTTVLHLDGALPSRVIIDLPIDRALCCPALDSVNGSLSGVLVLKGTSFTTGLGTSVNFVARFDLITLH